MHKNLQNLYGRNTIRQQTNTFPMGFLCSIIQDSIPCMKRATRCHKTTQCGAQATLVETTACINVMHGSLLSLYPRAAKRPTFAVRVALTQRLNSMLASRPAQQLEFINNHINLVKLCFMEHILNVFLDYMPCERELLCCTPSMLLYQSVCPTSCDAFRTECLLTGKKCSNFNSSSPHEKALDSLIAIFSDVSPIFRSRSMEDDG